MWRTRNRKALAVRRASEKCWIENKAMVYVFDLRLGVAQRVKPLPTMQETRVHSLGQEDPLEKEMATHSSTLVWKIPWMEEPVGSQRVGHNWATSLRLGFSGYARCTLSVWKGNCLNNRNIIEKERSFGKKNYLIGQVLVLGVNTPWVDPVSVLA